jgi:microcystin-dependent protein
MTPPYIGQIIMTGFGFTPRDFAPCNGQRLSIQKYPELFQVIGTLYGGDGVRDFAVPNLQGATPVGAGASADPGWTPTPYALNDSGGAETVVLKPDQVAGHTHGAQLAVANDANQRPPANAQLAVSSAANPTLVYGAADASVELAANTVTSVGASAGHPNMQPFRVVNFCIALRGVKPAPR